MRAHLLAAASALLFAGSASAADLPAPPPVEAAPVIYDWTGFYVGLHFGYAWNDFDVAEVDDGPEFDDLDLDDEDDIFGGIQLGYNMQAGNWVFGVEGDFSGTGIQAIDEDFEVFEIDVNWMATARGRVGYAWDSILIYATGGAAFVDVDAEYTPDTDEGTLFGYAVGAGLEWGFSENASVKLEYMFINADEETFELDPDTDISVEMQTVKLGLNYRF
jgi:outer membrane immunogenic protein